MRKLMFLLAALLFALPVLAVAPSITIISPLNQTYNQSSAGILLNITTVTSANATYSLDGAANVSIFNGGTAGTVLLNVSEGSHSVTVFAVNSTGNETNSSARGFTLNIIPALSAADNSGTVTFIVGNTTAAYALQANVTPSGGAADGVTVSFTLPYGFVNASACENGFSTSGTSSATCTKSYGAVASGVILKANLTVQLNLSAFTAYGASELRFSANCTDGSGCSQVQAAANYTGARQSINPRPDAIAPSNTTLLFTGWKQSEGAYDIMVPIYTFDSSLGRPVLANNSFGEIVYFGGKSFFEMPDFMKLYSYNLTFGISAGSAGVFSIRPPANGTNQGMQPLLVQTFASTDFFSNITRNFTNAFPNSGQFTVWRNGVRYNSTELAALGAAFLWPGGADTSSAMLVVNVTNTTFANAEWTVMITLANVSACGGSGSCQRSPLFVSSQQLSGWSFEEPPKFGQAVNQTFIINVSNSLENYTLNNIRVAFMQPMNVTMIDLSAGNTTKQFNMTTSPQLLLWNGTAYASSSAIYQANSIASFIDNYPGSPGYGNNITIYLTTFYLNLSAITGWNPGSSAQARFTASMVFPVMDESNYTPGTAGSSNSYNATINAPQSAPLNLTDKVPGLSSSSTSVVVKVDGVTIDSSNYTIGSLLLDNVDSGTHTVSVSYSVPAAASSSSSSSGGGGGGGGGGGAVLSQIINTISEMSAGVTYTISASAVQDLAFDELKVSSLSTRTNVKFTIKKLNGTALPAPSGSVYQYVQLDHDNLSDSDFASGKIKFSVSKIWLSSSGFTTGNVYLARYSSGWQKQSVLLTGETATDYLFEATMSGLSYLAIGADRPAASTQQTAPEPSVPAPAPQPAPAPEPAPLPVAGQQVAQLPAPADNSLIIYAIIGLVVIVGGWWHFHGSKRKLR